VLLYRVQGPLLLKGLGSGREILVFEAIVVGGGKCILFFFFLYRLFLVEERGRDARTVKGNIVVVVQSKECLEGRKKWGDGSIYVQTNNGVADQSAHRNIPDFPSNIYHPIE
jgi:hypothetical protein